MVESIIYKFYTSFYQEAPFPVFITDAAFTVIWTNNTAEERFSVLRMPSGLLSVLPFDNDQELYSAMMMNNRKPVMLSSRSIIGDMSFFCIPSFKDDEFLGACFQLFNKKWVDDQNLNQVMANNNEFSIAKFSIWGTELLSHNFALIRELAALNRISKDSRENAILGKLHQNNLKNLRFIRNCTLYSKYISGVQDYRPVKLDITRFAENLAKNLFAFFKNSRIEFSFFGPDKQACVTADENKLLEALLMLVSNACSSVKGKGKVGLSFLCEEDNIIITVSNSGTPQPGINLFRPWSLGEDYNQDDGLGLTLVQYIVNEHNGSIVYDSGNEGPAFVISLPVDRSGQSALCSQTDYIADRFSSVNIQLCDAL